VFELLSKQLFLTQDTSINFADRIDQDIAQSLALLMFSFLKIDTIPFINSRYFTELIALIAQILIEVTNKDL